VAELVALLLDPSGEPRDGVAVLGGEPFYQLAGLLVLLRSLKVRGVHVVVYTGYTLEALIRRREPQIREALRLVDLLIDGPYVAALADGAGEWRGSRNQRMLPRPPLPADMRFTAEAMACYTTIRGGWMKTVKIDVPEDLLALLKQSRLGGRPQAEQVRLALAIHLFQEAVISIGKAAELAGEPRASFELLLGEMGIPPVRHDETTYEREWEAIRRAREERQ
jgi:predicted HTH domain antitoxin